MIETVRSRLVPADFFKQRYTATRSEGVYSYAIALELEQGNARAALETAELARARAFIDLLASRDIKIDRPQSALARLPLTLRGADPVAAPADGRELPSLTCPQAPPARMISSPPLLVFDRPCSSTGSPTIVSSSGS